MSDHRRQEKLRTRVRRTVRFVRIATTRPVPGVDGWGATRVRDYPISRAK